jgi:hypothetical protein
MHFRGLPLEIFLVEEGALLGLVDSVKGKRGSFVKAVSRLLLKGENF